MDNKLSGIELYEVIRKIDPSNEISDKDADNILSMSSLLDGLIIARYEDYSVHDGQFCRGKT